MYSVHTPLDIILLCCSSMITVSNAFYIYSINLIYELIHCNYFVFFPILQQFCFLVSIPIRLPLHNRIIRYRNTHTFLYTLIDSFFACKNLSTAFLYCKGKLNSPSSNPGVLSSHCCTRPNRVGFFCSVSRLCNSSGLNAALQKLSYCISLMIIISAYLNPCCP